MSVERSCEQCGVSFRVKPYVISLGKGRFCGAPCANVAKTGKPSPKAIYGTRTCAICGNGYQSSHGKESCCSLGCGHEFRRRNMIAALETRLGEPVKPAIERRLASGMSMQTLTTEIGMSDSRALVRLMARLGIPKPTRSDAIKLQWQRSDPSRRVEQSKRWKAELAADPERTRARSIAANLKLQQTSPTSIERALMVALDAAGIPYEFQYVVGGKFLCDFGFPDAMLIVETDGSYWHRTERQKKRDASKDAYLRACGYTVLRLAEPDIRQRLDSCLSQIQALMGQELG